MLMCMTHPKAIIRITRPAPHAIFPPPHHHITGLQSSLNADAGTTSVAAVYTAFVLTSFFLPSLAMEFLKSRKSMVFGTIPYALYSVGKTTQCKTISLT